MRTYYNYVRFLVFKIDDAFQGASQKSQSGV